MNDKIKLTENEFRIKQAQFELTRVYNILFHTEDSRISSKYTYRDLYDLITNLVNITLENRRIVISCIHKDVTFNDITVGHSINVSMLATIIGDILDYKYFKLYDLALAAFLHDIGKRNIRSEILYKKGELTESEYEIIKHHPIESYSYVKRHFPEANTNILNGILQHHERLDGKGYPKGLSAEEISEYAQIISIADSYEAYTAVRPYHEKRSVNEGIKFIRENPGLNQDIVQKFTDSAAFYTAGLYVLLSDNTTAIIKEVNFGQKPIFIDSVTRQVIEDKGEEVVKVLSF